MGELNVDREVCDREPHHRIIEAVARFRLGPPPLDRRRQHLLELGDERCSLFDLQRDRQHLYAAIDLADPPLIRHAHPVVEHGVRALVADGVHRMDRDPGRVERDQEHRQAAVLGGVRIGPGKEEAVLRDVRTGGEHLLAVDDPVVAVADGTGPGRHDIGTGVRLGVSEADDGVAGRELGQHGCLLELGPNDLKHVTHEGAGREQHGVIPPAPQTEPEGHDPEGVPAATAESGVPGPRHPSLPREKPVDADVVAITAPMDLLELSGRDVVADEPPYFVRKPHDVVVREVHRGVSPLTLKPH